MTDEFGSKDIFECKREKMTSEVLRWIVVERSKELLLLQTLENGWFLDGYSVIRIDDITKYRFFDEEGSFERKVREKLGCSVKPPATPIDLSSMRSVAASLLAAGKMLSLEKENSYHNTMWLGKIQRITAKSLFLSELDSEAHWSHDHRHSIAAITNICCDNRSIRFYDKISRMTSR